MKKPSSSTGSVLIVAGAVMFAVICLIGFGFLSTRQAWRENSSKLLAQTLANQDMFSASNGLRAYITEQFASSALIHMSNAPKVISAASIGDERFQMFNFTAESDLSSLMAIQGGAALAPLTEANDPLYGIRAKSDVFNYRQTGRLAVESALGSRGARDQSADMKVEIRQFPLSQFSQFHAGNNVLTGTNLADLGRAHSNGDLTLETDCTALYPLTVAGRLNFGPSASIAVKTSPDANRSYGAGASTSINERRAVMQNTVVDQDVVKSTITTAATLSQMVSPPAVNLGTVTKNAQKLHSRCDVVIFYESATATFTARTRANTPDLTTVANMAVYTGTLEARASGHPVIELDIARLQSAGIAWTSYYLYSDDPQAIVMIRNGGTLPHQLSVVTPHDVWVDAAFNTPSNPAEIKPASIVTSGRVIGVDG